MRSIHLAAAGFMLAALGLAAPAMAQDIEQPMREFADAQVKAWLADPVVVDAVKAQNAANAGLTQEQIDALDTAWRAEVDAGATPTADAILANALSQFLAKLKADSQGLITEIFVMDAHGLNVGQSDVTSDYWQGDEAKWQETYAKGADAVHIGEVEKDESTQTLQSQLSLPIVDPASGEVIGAVTLGIDVDALTS